MTPASATPEGTPIRCLFESPQAHMTDARNSLTAAVAA